MTQLTPEEVKQNLPNWVRLLMIEKSEFYQNPNVYQHGFYDGYQLAQTQLKQEKKIVSDLLDQLDDTKKLLYEERERVSKLREALESIRERCITGIYDAADAAFVFQKTDIVLPKNNNQ